MKVALIAEWVDAWRGGAERSTLQFIHHLMDRDVEVHLYTRSRPSPAPGLAVHSVRGASMSRTRKTVTFMHRVENLLDRESFDVIHAISPCRAAHVYQPRGGTVAETIERNLALRRNGAARSLKRTTNRLNLKQRYMLSLERKLYAAGGPIIVAISDYVVAQLKKHYDVPDDRIRKIYNGVDPDESTPDVRASDRASVRKEFGVAEDDLLVVLIAHNFKLKGVQSWMEALALLRQNGVRNVRSFVIGKGDTQAWHTLAARLGLDDCLTFTGPTDRVHAFRHAADVLVHPTFYDPCSRVVLESLVGALPVITTRFDGAAEMIEDGVSGFVLDDPWDVQAIGDRVMQLRDPDRRGAMRDAALGVRDKMSMARHADELVTLYRSLVGCGAVG